MFVKKIAVIFLFSLLAGLGVIAGDVGWPREYPAADGRVILYQPQIKAWEDYKLLEFTAAVEIEPRSGKSAYGVVDMEAKSDTALGARTVTLSDFKVKDLRFPNTPADEAERLTKVVKSSLPLDKNIAVSVDRLLAEMQRARTQRVIDVSLKPPQIFFSDKPAVLVNFIGKPQFKTASGSLLAAVNTNWDVFLDSSSARYYILNEGVWLTAKDLYKDSWEIAKKLPADFYTLPADPNWEDVRQSLQGGGKAKEPHVFVSTEPAELIVTAGDPAFSPIPGTQLMDVVNTDSVLFYHTPQKQFYLQVAGRWFRAKHLKGPWTSASEDLPGDFAAIPDDNENAFVKASVPGTQEAQDAVLLASVPQRTVVRKADAKCVVIYDGSPRFIEIKETPVKYAINSPNDVFLVENKYYCCSQGMWFESTSPQGPWVLCALVPQSLYAIPATHPKHNVTYVYVYDSTPDTVYVGYTSGYSGEYVAKSGVLMFGLGVAVGVALANDWDDDCWHWHYSYGCHVHYYGWGCGAVYHHGYGGFYRGAVHYGPYGGAGRVGYYNPATGGWARGGAIYGPRGSASFRQGYNPFTDTYAARVNVNTPHGSSGRFYAERGNNSVWGGHESGRRGSVAWAENEKGGAIVHGEGLRGQGTIAKDKDGNIYVGKDGNVYKRDADGGWSSNSDKGWNSSNRPSTTSAAGSGRSEGLGERPATQDREPVARSNNDSLRQLESSAQSRRRGNLNTERSAKPIGDRASRSSAGGRRR